MTKKSNIPIDFDIESLINRIRIIELPSGDNTVDVRDGNHVLMVDSYRTGSKKISLPVFLNGIINYIHDHGELILPTSTPNQVLSTDETNTIVWKDQEHQVNADWESNSGISKILNKPNLDIYATKEQVDEKIRIESTLRDTKDIELDDKITLQKDRIDVIKYAVVVKGYKSVEQLKALSCPEKRVGNAFILTNDGKLNNNSLLVRTGDVVVYDSNAEWIILAHAPISQVNADWNATSGPAAILNKPNLATVATSGNYTDLNASSIPQHLRSKQTPNTMLAANENGDASFMDPEEFLKIKTIEL